MAQVPDRITLTFEYHDYPKAAAPTTSNFDAASSLHQFLVGLGLPASSFNGDVQLDSATLTPSSDPDPSNPPARVEVVISDAASIETFVNDEKYVADP